MIFSEDPETVDRVDGQAQAEAAAAEMMFYAFELAKKWRGSDENNVKAVNCNGEIDGEPISDETFAWIVLMLISASNESTRTTITHAMKNLINNPEQYRYLQQHLKKWMMLYTKCYVSIRPLYVCAEPLLKILLRKLKQCRN